MHPGTGGCRRRQRKPARRLWLPAPALGVLGATWRALLGARRPPKPPVHPISPQNCGPPSPRSSNHRPAQVCDSKARQLTNEQRSAVAEYFSLSKGVDGGKKVSRRGRQSLAVSELSPPPAQLRLSFPLHPSLQRAHDTVLREQWLQVRLARPVSRARGTEQHPGRASRPSTACWRRLRRWTRC